MIALLGGTSEPLRAPPVDVGEKACAVGDDPGNVGLTFLGTALRFREHPAFVTPQQQLPYFFFHRAARNVSHFLSHQPDFRPGDRVLLLAGNSPEYLAGFYGTLLAGGVVVPLPTTVEMRRLEHVRADSGARILFVNDQVTQRRNDLSLVPNERVDLSTESPAPCDRTSPVGRNDLALLLYTSGSTTRPKGVMLSHGNLLANARSILGYLPIRHQDWTLALLPFCHAFGNSVLQTHVLSGATLVVAGSPVFPNTIVEAMQRHRISSFAGVPELYHALLSHSELGRCPLPDLRYMTVAGGGLPPEAALRVTELIAPAQFFAMYGQTEATARLAYLRPEHLPQRPGAIGKAIPGVELQVQDTRGRQVAPGETGEICARGANVMLGYWNDATATADALRGGWLRTGDLASADEDGFLHFKGRKTSEVKIRGMRVDVAAVTDALSVTLPGRRLVVVPFRLNQTTRLALFVVGNDRSVPSVERIQEICRKTLARHEVPAYIEIIDRLSLNDALKIDLPALTQRAAERYESSRFTTATTCGEMSNIVTEVPI